MRLYDTRTQQFQPFTPGHVVRLYVCGITPYDAAHLGHAFVYTTFDVLTRALIARGHKVISIRNVTDLDDDTLRMARKRDINYQVMARSEAARCAVNFQRLGLLPPTGEPYVSETMDAIIAFIKMLIANKTAYVLDDHRVYANVSRFPYLHFSGLDRETAIAQFREKGGDPDAPGKVDPLDFLLWQPSEADEPAWAAPWGEGRPGWHIGCSAMCHTHLGPTIDIHGGGSDLIFPHHEAEILQMEKLTGQQPFAKVWMHTGMVALEGTKMSKSLGNLVFIEDLLRDYHPDAIRALLLSHHYRSDWTYSRALLEQAAARVARWHQALKGWKGTTVEPSHVALCKEEEGNYVEDVLRHVEDDLDARSAMNLMDQLANVGETQALLFSGSVLGFFQPAPFNAVR